MKNSLSRLLAAVTVFAATTFLFLAPAMAYEPKPTELGLQPAASPNMERLHFFHDHILVYVITGIVIFVALLLLWVILRYNAKANPVPSKTTHNVPLEVLWTVLPVVILIVIAIPSFKLLFYLNRTADPDMTLKVSGYQWGWTYTYPDHDGIEFNADIIRGSKHADGSAATPEEDMAEINKYIPDGNGRRLLETYNPIVLPIEKNIRILTTATDVIHSWTIPAFGAKKDAVPGRTNETWFRIEAPGVYFGQCSEICGIDHSAMPITAYAVPVAEYDQWVSCMTGADSAEKNADYPSRACVQKLGFDKYRLNKTDKMAKVDGASE